jgi:hypothetical protein
MELTRYLSDEINNAHAKTVERPPELEPTP